jgi:putative ABC transport system ATP-binding protein
VSQTPVVSCRDLEKVLGPLQAPVRAVAGVSLRLERGELTLIMGPSGSGKTTLLALLGGLLRPTRGEVQILGVDIWRLRPRERTLFRLRHIGFVFQQPSLLPSLTARENVALVMAQNGLSTREALQKADELLEKVGLQGHGPSFSATLSGGEQQRVVIARALANDPELLLADEPTASLDSRAGQEVMEEIRKRVKEKGRAALVVTHDHRLLPFADRVIWMEDGRVREA